MDFSNLISTQRANHSLSDLSHNRNEFQRDYDRIIFSSAFRRLQNKTQVFPLPRRIFVHNRLTHSLEVSSVGRSLGSIVADKLSHQYDLPEGSDFIFSAIISSACLAHDMGNPPFGHFGENAIAEFFENEAGSQYKEHLLPQEWADFIRFDGNANTFRILTHGFEGRRTGGYSLTYATLASVIKYPFEAIASNKQKFGFFQSEKETFLEVVETMGMKKLSDNPLSYARHPFVYLVEAADDICYGIMDIEDAHKLSLISTDKTMELFMAFFNEKEREHIYKRIAVVSDMNERIGAIRAYIINSMVKACSDGFVKNWEKILKGEPCKPLIDELEPRLAKAIVDVKTISFQQIYNSKPVADIEVAGYKILLSLLEEFSHAFMTPQKAYSQKLMKRVPMQYIENHASVYGKLQNVVDFVTSMTDTYALNLYKTIKGIELPNFI